MFGSIRHQQVRVYLDKLLRAGIYFVYFGQYTEAKLEGIINEIQIKGIINEIQKIDFYSKNPHPKSRLAINLLGFFTVNVHFPIKSLFHLSVFFFPQIIKKPLNRLNKIKKP